MQYHYTCVLYKHDEELLLASCDGRPCNNRLRLDIRTKLAVFFFFLLRGAIEIGLLILELQQCLLQNCWDPLADDTLIEADVLAESSKEKLRAAHISSSAGFSVAGSVGLPALASSASENALPCSLLRRYIGYGSRVPDGSAFLLGKPRNLKNLSVCVTKGLEQCSLSVIKVYSARLPFCQKSLNRCQK